MSEPETPGARVTQEASDASLSQQGDYSNHTDVVSLGNEPFQPMSYIDLTGRDVCRAIYKSRFEGQRSPVPLVCGRVDCSYHRNVRKEDRAEPAFYVRQSRRGVDHGRHDLPAYPVDEFEEAVAEYNLKVAEEAAGTLGGAQGSETEDRSGATGEDTPPTQG